MFSAWQHVVLDIDGDTKPDVQCDAREMHGLEPNAYDAVFSSHMLEHFPAHEVGRVLTGCHHVLNPGGMVLAVVPDVAGVMRRMVAEGKDIDDECYLTADGLSISFHDIVYGWGRMIEQGNGYYAHKRGYSLKSFSTGFSAAGFPHVYCHAFEYDLTVWAFKAPPTEAQRKMFQLD